MVRVLPAGQTAGKKYQLMQEQQSPSQVPQLPRMSLPEASELGNLIKWLPNCNPRICNQPSYLSQNLIVGIFHKESISMLGNMKESLSKMDTIVTHDKNDTL